jgi:hypothetical protein
MNDAPQLARQRLFAGEVVKRIGRWPQGRQQKDGGNDGDRYPQQF